MPDGSFTPEGVLQAEVTNPEPAKTNQKEVPLTSEQKKRLREIRAVRQEVGYFDHPKRFYYDSDRKKWEAKRPFKNKEEAVQAFAQLTGTTVEEVNNIWEAQKRADSNFRYSEGDPARTYNPARQAAYHEAESERSRTRDIEEHLIIKAARDYKPQVAANSSPSLIKSS